tara:strand:- start:4504 stop:5391 length:888 start_codon:yes stop_codon:yes gene_type:complete
MSQNTQNPLPAVDRTLPFAMQMGGLAEVMLDFFTSKRTKITIPITFDVHGVPAFTFNGSIPTEPSHLRTYTRKELREILVTSVELGHQYGNADFKAKVPTYTSTAPHMVAMLQRSYVVSKGPNEGQIRNLWAHAMASARGQLKRVAQANLKATVVADGDAWYAEGIVDSNGNPRVYVNENKARKAFIRATVGDDWYVGLDKTAKAELLKTASVYKQGHKVEVVKKAGNTPKHVAQSASTPYTLDVLAEMPTVTVIQIAKKAGAPESVYKGQGAKDRSITWIGDNPTLVAKADATL